MARQGAQSMEELLKKVQRIRRWSKSRLTRRGPCTLDFQFTVMTYNILSQSALDNHRNLYYNRACLGEDYRVARILPEILHSRSDVVCLQEVEQRVFDHRLKGALHAKGFSSLFKRRTGDKTDGCAILWRRDRFDLVKHTDLELKSGIRLLDRDNVALIAVLKPLHPDARDTLLHVATTHLLFNPRRGDVKLCQMRWLLAAVEHMAFKRQKPDGHRQYHPVILCGDFNFEPYSPIYRFVNEGEFDVAGNTLYGDLSGQEEGKGKGNPVNMKELSMTEFGISDTTRFIPESNSSSPEEVELGQQEASDDRPKIFTHDLKLVPAYQYHYLDRSKDLPITSMTKKSCSTVDHIFYSVSKKYEENRYTEGKLQLLYTYSLPYPSRLAELGGMPNELFGSDHLCLLAQFGLDFDR